MKPTWAFFVVLSVLGADLPSPVIHSGLADGSGTVSGAFSRTSSAGVTTIKVVVDGKEANSVRTLIDADRGEFVVELAQPLTGGQTVQVQQISGADKSPLSPARRVSAIPEIRGALNTDSKKVTVRSAPGAGSVIVVVTGADGTRAQEIEGPLPAECAFDKSDKCVWEITLKGDLAEKERVQVKERGGQLSEAASVKAAPAQPYQAKVHSVAAYYGAGSLTVYFEKLPETIEKASATVVTCLEQKVYSFSADDLKATKVDIPLSRGLYCPLAKDEMKRVQIIVTPKGGKPSAGTETQFVLLAPGLSMQQVLYEGSGRVTGKVSGGIDKVNVLVFAGWAPVSLQKQLDNNAAESARLEAEGQKVVAATARQAEQKARINKRMETLSKEAKQLRYQAARIQNVLFSAESQNTAGLEVDTAKQCLTSELIQEVKSVPVTDGVFLATLDSKLNAGDCVLAFADFAYPGEAPVDSQGPKRIEIASAPSIAKSTLLDFGRLRAYFTLGGAISHYRQQFGQVDTFVGFTGDARVFGEVLDKSLPGFSLKNGFRYHINAFLDARVSVKLASTGSGAAASGQAAAAAQTATSAPLLTPRLDFAADQPGYFAFGLHAPMSLKGMDWQHRGRTYSFFGGPIGRIGGQTQSAETVVFRNLYAQRSTIDGKSVTTFTINREETRGGVLPAFGYGARFGIFQYELLGNSQKQRQVANDLLGYVDFVWGKNHAYRSYQYAYKIGNETYLADNFQFIANDQLKEVAISSSVRPRLYIEGRLKIPTLPALIGVDYGVRTNARGSEPNQFRFVLAFRIDANRAIGRVFPNQELLKGN